MLKLKNIVKTYVMGDKKSKTQIKALRGIDLEFRKNDFVAILGQSGCGKTTMLNIIGGLDRYTSGDLVINGVSTKEYKDVDWDIYRNNSIGFVFQSYNLISHQTVFTNVELALTLAGVSAAERKRRVTEALEKVGLADQIHKKPTQMSGGQMQRVAIARALVNNPEILLADEPTGALDSETSLQIMELLEEIAKDRLVIMVTHNSEIAQKYATRTIKLLDGKVIDDSNPYHSGEEVKKEKTKRKKTSMSFSTALSLSFKNLLTKKTRTVLTAFAGSIGIIGIALILSLSSGMQIYVNNLERDTLSTYPLEIESRSMDMAGMMTMMMSSNRSDVDERDLDKVYVNSIMGDMIQSASSQISNNDLRQLKAYIESETGASFYDYTNAITYSYGVELQIYKETQDGLLQVNPSEVLASLGMGSSPMDDMRGGMNMGMGSSDVWTEMLDNEELLHSQFDLVAGKWATEYNEVVLVLDSNNELSDMTLYSLGLLDGDELEKIMTHAMKGEEYVSEAAQDSFSYDEMLSLSYKILLNTDYYVMGESHWEDIRDNENSNEILRGIVENALEVNVVGIIRPNENAAATAINGSVGYTSALTEYILNAILETEIAQEQLANPDVNVFTGFDFDISGFVENLTIDDVREMLMDMLTEMPDETAEVPENMSEEELAQYAEMMSDMPDISEMSDKELLLFIASLQMNEEEAAQFNAMAEDMTEEQLLAMLAEQITANLTDSETYENNLALLGIADMDNPSTIRLYPKDFNSKKEIESLIEEYNQMQTEAGNDEFVINYTDIVGLMTSSISSIIGIVSYVLIAFVAISLVVSSIMIAIITYISVLERTKEIGILRSIGASKKDITRVFNAETIIEGFVAGTMGVLIAVLLNIPINALINSLAGISGVSVLPLWGAIGLIAISVFLTVIAGFIPSKMAAKKDPVVALRTE